MLGATCCCFNKSTVTFQTHQDGFITAQQLCFPHAWRPPRAAMRLQRHARLLMELRGNFSAVALLAVLFVHQGEHVLARWALRANRKSLSLCGGARKMKVRGLNCDTAAAARPRIQGEKTAILKGTRSIRVYQVITYTATTT